MSVGRMFAAVHVVNIGMTIEKPFDPRYNDLNDPATVNLTETICAGVSKQENVDVAKEMDL